MGLRIEGVVESLPLPLLPQRLQVRLSTMTLTPLTSAKEKMDVDPVAVEDVSYHPSSDDCSPILTAEEEKRLWRKVDMRLIPISVLLYLMSYLDRGNIGSFLLYGNTNERILIPQYRKCEA